MEILEVKMEPSFADKSQSKCMGSFSFNSDYVR